MPLRHNKHILVFLLVIFTNCTAKCSPSNFTITLTDSFVPFLPFVADYYAWADLVIQDINNNENILPNTLLSVDIHSQFASASVGLQQMIDFDSQNKTFIVGNALSSVSVQTGIAGSVFGIAQISPAATVSALSNKHIYPYYTRMVPPNNQQVDVVIAAIHYYGSLEDGWDKVAIVSTTNEYGIDVSQTFIRSASDSLEILTYQQYIPGENYDIEIRELVNSGARIIVAYLGVGPDEFTLFVKTAAEAGLVGDNYVWFTGSVATFAQPQNATTAAFMQGMMAVATYHPPTTPQFEDFLERWSNENLTVQQSSKTGYDTIIATALTLDALDKRGILDQPRISGEVIANTLRTVEFEGISGPVKFDSNGDLISEYQLLYFNSTNNIWTTAAIFTDGEKFEFIRDVVFYSRSTEVPDLDIREPRKYWSCHDGEFYIDESGKTIQIHSPGSKDVDDIDSDYYCDNFIDCENFSDESVDCISNYKVVFIVFGIITGLMILLCLILFVFVVVFGVILRYRRLRRVSPNILLLLLISMIIGYASVYAWFGKPHKVACGFQPWLLGCSSIGMIAALCTKNYRIWRIFRKPFGKVLISDLYLLFIWGGLMVPVVVILTLWMIISTPTAKLEDFGGVDHYVCATGGFTGAPGGYVFFFLLVAYGAVILICGVFITILVRNIPDEFNESKLLAISIYNIAFLSVVIIPVFLVVQPINPFAAWILRTVAILYAFSATLFLQFVEPVIGIVVFDKFANKKHFKSNVYMGSTPTSQSKQSTSQTKQSQLSQ